MGFIVSGFTGDAAPGNGPYVADGTNDGQPCYRGPAGPNPSYPWWWLFYISAPIGDNPAGWYLGFDKALYEYGAYGQGPIATDGLPGSWTAIGYFGSPVVVAGYKVSGTILDDNANPIPGVLVTATAAGKTAVTATTGADGTYTLALLVAATWTLTPTKAHYTFTPTTHSEVVSTADITGADFAALAANSVSGTILFGGTPLANVRVYAGALSALTNSYGAYSLGIGPGAYVLVPELAGYTFAPEYIPVTMAEDDLTGEDFAATWLGGTAQDPVGIFQGAMFAPEESYGVLPDSPTWFALPTQDAPITGNQGLVDAKALRFGRIRGIRAVAGPWTGAGTLKIESGPEDIATMLYMAFGAVDSVLHAGSTTAYDHTFQYGTAQKSFTLDVAIRDALDTDAPAKRWMRYPGCTISKLLVDLAIGQYIMANVSVDPAKPLQYEGVHVPVFSALRPLLAVKGAFELPIGTGFEVGEKASLEIDFGVLRRRALFQRGWAGAGAGQPQALITVTPYLHAQAVAELARFMGHQGFDFSGGAVLDLAGAILDNASMKLVSETEEFADTEIPYALTASGQNLALQEHGAILKGPGLMDAELHYRALFDPTSDSLFNLVLTNKLTNSQITCGL